MNNDKIKTLQKLADYFEKPLYIVGGAVRNALLNYNIEDYDLAAAITPEEVFERLEGTEFKVSETSKKLFTLSIKKGKDIFEFTSFRQDSYSRGNHRPYHSEFSMDIKEDAQRRDFRINAIYYDIKNKKIVDPLNGRDDLKQGTIKTVSDPKEVFSQDGLRLMRLARQSAELDMEIDSAAFKAAKKYSYLIKDIAWERIRDEFNKIISADYKYGKQKAHVKGMNLLDSLGILNYIMPELMNTKGVKQRRDYHKYNVYEHIMKAYEYSPERVRLAALFHDIAKPLCIKEDGSMSGHDKKGGEVASQIMNRFRYSNKEIKFTCRLVRLHMYDLKGEAKESTLRKFIQKNHDIIDSLIELKYADHKASGMMRGECVSATRLKKTYENMKKEGIPFNIKQLEVTGKDLIDMGVPEAKRGKALNALLEAVIFGGDMLTKQNQLNYIKKNKKNF